MTDLAPPHAAPAGAPAPGRLAVARYGKDLVRVFRVVREGSWHHVVEYNVCALVEGAIETRCAPPGRPGRARARAEQKHSFTEADNSVVVATDSSACARWARDGSADRRPGLS
jgi:urate oxidase